jgi:hypothetical protein
MAAYITSTPRHQNSHTHSPLEAFARNLHYLHD